MGLLGDAHAIALMLATFVIQMVFVGVVVLNLSAPQVDQNSVADVTRRAVLRYVLNHLHPTIIYNYNLYI